MILTFRSCYAGILTLQVLHSRKEMKDLHSRKEMKEMTCYAGPMVLPPM
jgi:hypothetical protein